MDYYTSESSLEATFGVDETVGLLGDDPDVRLEKAAKEAYDVINAYLSSAGYETPLVFTPFGKNPTIDAPLLDGRIQVISDNFTAAALAQFTDLNKKVYDQGKADGLDWLEKVRVGIVRLAFPRTVAISGSGQVATISRPRVFTSYLLSPDAAFPTNKG